MDPRPRLHVCRMQLGGGPRSANYRHSAAFLDPTRQRIGGPHERAGLLHRYVPLIPIHQ